MQMITTITAMEQLQKRKYNFVLLTIQRGKYVIEKVVSNN